MAHLHQVTDRALGPSTTRNRPMSRPEHRARNVAPSHRDISQTGQIARRSTLELPKNREAPRPTGSRADSEVRRPDEQAAAGALNKPLDHLGKLVEGGHLRPGDRITTTNVKDPHHPANTYTYKGDRRFEDASGQIRTADELARERPDERIHHLEIDHQARASAPVQDVTAPSAPAAENRVRPGSVHGRRPGGRSAGRSGQPLEGARRGVEATEGARGGSVPAGSISGLLKKLEGMGVDRAFLEKMSRQYGVPVPIILGVMMQESKGDPNAGSSAGARGLMQLMPGTFRQMGGGNILDPRTNIEAGVKYLAEMHRQFPAWSQAVGHYNSGPGGNLTNRETRAYIPRVMAYADQAAAALQTQLA